MTIQEDILMLEQKQKDYFSIKNKYLQCLQTPETIPMVESKVDFTKLRKPDDAIDELEFIPKEKDYAFKVDVWTKLDRGVESSGFVVTAKRDLGDGIIEIITKGEPE